MLRKIQDFLLDDRDRWVALLRCGHLMEVPADAAPPAPEWARSEHGRKNLVGSLLDCGACTGASARDARPAPGAAFVPPEGARLRARREPSRPAWRRPIRLDDRVAFGRIRSVGDLGRLAQDGVRSVVCLDQPGDPEQTLPPLVEASWVRALAMTPYWIPVDPSRVHERDVDRFLQALREAESPIFVGSSNEARSSAFAALWIGASTGCTDLLARGRAASLGLPPDPACDAALRLLLDPQRRRDPRAVHACFALHPRPHVVGRDLDRARGPSPAPATASSGTPTASESVDSRSISGAEPVSAYNCSLDHERTRTD